MYVGMYVCMYVSPLPDYNSMIVHYITSCDRDPGSRVPSKAITTTKAVCDGRPGTRVTSISSFPFLPGLILLRPYPLPHPVPVSLVSPLRLTIGTGMFLGVTMLGFYTTLQQTTISQTTISIRKPHKDSRVLTAPGGVACEQCCAAS